MTDTVINSVGSSGYMARPFESDFELPGFKLHKFIICNPKIR